ncbi:MAG: hypothetical protein J5798_07870 [Spirochaetaceae bacterium]|nr:hypothetical protein [Spirochaetaceae bacterium]
MKALFNHQHATDYGYVDFEKREFYGKREMTADQYVAFSGIYCDHMVIPELFNTQFFEGLRNAVLAHGNKIVFNDTYVMYLARKPGIKGELRNAINKLISALSVFRMTLLCGLK